MPRRRYYEIQQTGQELAKLSHCFEGVRSCYDALIVKDYDNVWGHEIKQHAREFDYRNLLYDYYKANADLQVNTAVSKGNYEDYKVVYMPAYNIVDQAEVDRVKDYVENGGTLVLTFRSGGRDPYNNLFETTLPCAFRELAGIEVEEFDALRKETHITGLVNGTAKVWCDVLKPVTAEVLCTYADRYFRGQAAVTVNTFGKGRVYYVGCDLDAEAMSVLVRHISAEAGIEVLDLPAGVELVRRENCTVLLNHNEEPVETGIEGYSLMSEAEFHGRMEGYGVEVLRK